MKGNISYIEFDLSMYSGKIKLSFDHKYKHEKDECIDEQELDTYISLSEKFWEPAAQLAGFIMGVDRTKILLGRIRKAHRIMVNYSEIVIERNTEGIASNLEEWKSITGLLPLREYAMSFNRTIDEGYVDFLFFPFNDVVGEPSHAQITTAMNRLTLLKKGIEVHLTKIACLSLAEDCIKVAFQEPQWEEELPKDGFSGFWFRGIIV